jgi:hypothetical protein
MADISMCNGKGCDLKEYCYRFTATPDSIAQTYTNFQPDLETMYGEKHCDFFWFNEKPNTTRTK